MPPSSAAYLESAAQLASQAHYLHAGFAEPFEHRGAVDLGDGACVVGGVALGGKPGDPVAEHPRDLNVDCGVGELVPNAEVVYQP